MLKLCKKLASAAVILSMSSLVAASTPEKYAEDLMPFVEALSTRDFAPGYVRSPTSGETLFFRANQGDRASQNEIMERVYRLGDCVYGDKLSAKIEWDVWPHLSHALENPMYAHFMLATIGKGLEDKSHFFILFDINRKADQSNDSHALYNLGYMLLHGIGHEQNTQYAINSYRKAARYGSVEASYALGLLYGSNKFVTTNLTRSFGYLANAALAGHAMAQLKLSDMLESQKEFSHLGMQRIFLGNRLQVLYDKEELQHKLLLSAYNRGVWQSYAKIGCYYLKYYEEFLVNRPQWNHWLPSNEQILEQATQYLMQAVDINKDRQSCFALGDVFRKGYILNPDNSKDYGAAAKWYGEAARQGHREAKYQLARLLLKGRIPGPTSVSEGLAFLREAASKGHIQAEYILGESLLNGQFGLEQNTDEGLTWLKIAAKMNHRRAIKSLIEFYWPNNAEPLNRVEAVRYMLRADQLVNMPDRSYRGKIASLFTRGYGFMDEVLLSCNFGKHAKIMAEEFEGYQPQHHSSIARLSNHMDKLYLMVRGYAHDSAVATILSPVTQRLWEYCNQYAQIWIHLLKSPVMLTNFSWAPLGQSELVAQDEPHFLHRYTQDGVQYLTVGTENVAKIRAIDNLLSDEGASLFTDDYGIFQRELAKHALVTAAQKVHALYLSKRLELLHGMYGGLELDDPTVAEILTFGQAMATIDQIINSYTQSLSELDVKRADALESLREAGMKASDLELSEAALSAGEKCLVAGLDWFTQMKHLLVAAKTELKAMVSNTRLRDEAANNDEFFKNLKTIIRLYKY